MNNIIGKTVIVTVDRQIGTHHPKHNDIVYPINYGYIKDIVGGDGEVQDAYILDIDYPVDTYTGQVIAIINRLDDIETKWVISNKVYTKEEIMEKVLFQEQYFNIEM